VRILQGVSDGEIELMCSESCTWLVHGNLVDANGYTVQGNPHGASKPTASVALCDSSDIYNICIIVFGVYLARKSELTANGKPQALSTCPHPCRAALWHTVRSITAGCTTC
jgi:hypothetical protein